MSKLIAGPHTRHLWESVAPIVEDIENLPFIEQMTEGTLDPRAFIYYLLQDEVYLDGYSRAMAQLANKANTMNDMSFWTRSSGQAVIEEMDLHNELFADESFRDSLREILAENQDKRGLVYVGHNDQHGKAAEGMVVSPTALGYVSFLKATVALRSYEVGAAAVLPCFWVYAHIAKVIVAKVAGKLDNNPFAAWIKSYDSEEFDNSAGKAIAIVERLMEETTQTIRDEMLAVFKQAALYELHFWASAHVFQDWTTPQLEAN